MKSKYHEGIAQQALTLGITASFIETGKGEFDFTFSTPPQIPEGSDMIAYTSSDPSV